MMEKQILVIGASNLDVNLTTKNMITKFVSNPSHINLSPGGVARNIAENIVKLGNKCHLISVFSDDIFGEFLKNDCKNKSINYSNSIFIKGENSSSYISLNNKKGEMEYGFSSTEILKNLNINNLKKINELFLSCSAIVIDTNIPTKTFEYIIKTYKDIPIFVDTVSIYKAKKVIPFLKDIFFLKPNYSEAMILSGYDEKAKVNPKILANKLNSMGVNKVFISNGQKSSYYSDNNISKEYIPPKLKVKNVSGAGDSLIAGFVHGFINNLDWDYTNKLAMSLSALNLKSDNCVNQIINNEILNAFIKENNFD